MPSVLTWHLLVFYPVLILSPFIPSYTIHNSYLNTSTTVTVEGYDANSVRRVIPAGAAAYVQNVTVNRVPTASRCHFDFYDTFRIDGNITISVTSNKTSVNDCAGPVPESISTGGFAVPRQVRVRAHFIVSAVSKYALCT
ncbi:glycoside hydrolase family 92 protein [Athelia psychrophila]|uniref:Glycoside hydrolase family 92 protein n=1 Tax=Athelia psychrophila TaxID=1759441 RepID=A0A167TES0_9AGAM|nr:glycoside hydrolase family 92 protein [Fibularhizoctonia sp. CBS 109695]